MKRKTAINLITITAFALLFSWEITYAQEEKRGEETEKVEEFSGEEKAKEVSGEEKGAVSDLVNFIKRFLFIKFKYC